MKHGLKDIAFYVQKHITPCTVVKTSLLVCDKPLEAPASVKRVYCHCIYIHPISHITRLYRFLTRYKCLHGPLCPVRRRQSSRYWLCRAHMEKERLTSLKAVSTCTHVRCRLRVPPEPETAWRGNAVEPLILLLVFCAAKPPWVHFLSIVLGHITTASVNLKTRYISNGFLH